MCSCEEEETDYLMYVSEITAYWAASVAAIIYIWETVLKGIRTKKLKKPRDDPELGLIGEDEESVFSNNSSRENSPLEGLRSRIYSSTSSK